MTNRRARVALCAVVCAAVCALAGCRRPEPAPQISMIPSHAESPDAAAPPARELPAGRIEVAGVSFEPPGAWRREDPSSPMRAAQYTIPGLGNEKDGLFVVYFFGPGQGGSVDENVRRWQGQFTADGGGEAAADVRAETRGGFRVTTITAQGTFASGMPMGPATPEPHSALWGAIVEGPHGNVFFKATGPRATIASAKSAFTSLLDSLRGSATSM